LDGSQESAPGFARSFEKGRAVEMKLKSKPRWLDRCIHNLKPFYLLCLSQTEYDKQMAKLEVKNYPADFVLEGSSASVHWFTSNEGTEIALVCLDGKDAMKQPPVEVFGLLIHEAVHIWQTHCEQIGEKAPASEQEAYAIQIISKELIFEFARRTQMKGIFQTV
jgi:hypothetical protein